jgi:hypothetical protein
VSYRPDAQLSKAPAVRTMSHTVWTHINLKHHPSERRELSVRTFPYVEKFQTAPACIRLDVLAARPDDSQCSIKLQDFFPNHKYGKIAATVRMMWITVWTHSSIRQVSQFKSKCPDASQHGPDARASDMKIACIKSTVRTTILLVQTRKASIWKLLATDVRPSGRGSFQERILVKFSENDCTVVRLDGTQFLSSQTLI